MKLLSLIAILATGLLSTSVFAGVFSASTSNATNQYPKKCKIIVRVNSSLQPGSDFVMFNALSPVYPAPPKFNYSPTTGAVQPGNQKVIKVFCGGIGGLPISYTVTANPGYGGAAADISPINGVACSNSSISFDGTAGASNAVVYPNNFHQCLFAGIKP